MDTSANTIQNNALATAAARAPDHVLKSILKASAHTGVNFAYLLQQANTESSFNPTAKAKTSSARGLYQFIDSTWMSMVKKYGDKYGMGNLACQINDNGTCSNSAVKKQILALRNDPEKASAMAAEFANENKDFLQDHWGGQIGSTELYLAHFMGAGGAAEFLKAKDQNPLQQAAMLFPKAAETNRNVFYDTSTGRPKTLGEVYAFFDKKFDIKTDQLPAVADTAAPAQIADISDFKNEILSNVFKSGHNFTSLTASGYHSLMANPIDVIMLSQLSTPGQTGAGHKQKSIF